MGTFLRARLGSPLVDRLAGPLVGGVYGTPIDELSLDAVVPQLRVAERDHRSLLLAGLADGRAMRAAAAARPTGEPGFGTFASLRDGMDKLVTALSASLAASGVQSPDRAPGPVAPAGRDRRRGRGSPTGPRAGSARSSSPHRRPSPRRSSRTRSPVRPRRWRRSRTAARSSSRSAIRATASAASSTGTGISSRPGRAGRSPPRPGRPRSGPAAPPTTWSSCACRSATSRRGRRATTRRSSRPRATTSSGRCASRRQPVLTRLMRWTGSMPRYTVGHLGRVAAIEAAMTAWPAVTLAGASYRGVGLPDCIAQGQAAAARVNAWLASDPGVAGRRGDRARRLTARSISRRAPPGAPAAGPSSRGRTGCGRSAPRGRTRRRDSDRAARRPPRPSRTALRRSSPDCGRCGSSQPVQARSASSRESRITTLPLNVRSISRSSRPTASQAARRIASDAASSAGEP